MNNVPVKLIEPGTVLAATTTYTVDLLAAKGMMLLLRITAVAGTTPTLDIKVQDVETGSGVGIDVPGAAFTQKTGATTDSLVIYPGVTVSANRGVSTHLGRAVNVVATIGGTAGPTFTLSLSAVKLI